MNKGVLFTYRSVNVLLEKVTAVQLVRSWSVAKRLQHAAQDAERQARNQAAAAAGSPMEHFYRRLYLPEHGMFADLPTDLGIGTKQEVSLSHILPSLASLKLASTICK